MNKLKASTIAIKKVTNEDIDQMFSLFALFYENVERQKFQKDLFNKDRVIVLKDRATKKIRGFSTIKEIEVKKGSKIIYGIFSGDTIIDPDYWGQTALTMEFFKNLLHTKKKHPFSELYWFLISKGYKTYLLLTNNFMNYYPRFDKETPAKHNMILDAFGSELFPDTYNLDKKIIELADRNDHLKHNVAPITEEALQNPNIKFFQETNPLWAKGDELCCIGRVDLGLAIKYLTRTYKKRLLMMKKIKAKLGNTFES